MAGVVCRYLQFLNLNTVALHINTRQYGHRHAVGCNCECANYGWSIAIEDNIVRHG